VLSVTHASWFLEDISFHDNAFCCFRHRKGIKIKSLGKNYPSSWEKTFLTPLSQKREKFGKFASDLLVKEVAQLPRLCLLVKINQFT
jgi:hypothetical protein